MRNYSFHLNSPAFPFFPHWVLPVLLICPWIFSCDRWASTPSARACTRTQEPRLCLAQAPGLRWLPECAGFMSRSGLVAAWGDGNVNSRMWSVTVWSWPSLGQLYLSYFVCGICHTYMHEEDRLLALLRRDVIISLLRCWDKVMADLIMFFTFLSRQANFSPFKCFHLALPSLQLHFQLCQSPDAPHKWITCTTLQFTRTIYQELCWNTREVCQ